jgi:hypothetical protein
MLQSWCLKFRNRHSLRTWERAPLALHCIALVGPWTLVPRPAGPAEKSIPPVGEYVRAHTDILYSAAVSVCIWLLSA